MQHIKRKPQGSSRSRSLPTTVRPGVQITRHGVVLYSTSNDRSRGTNDNTARRCVSSCRPRLIQKHSRGQYSTAFQFISWRLSAQSREFCMETTLHTILPATINPRAPRTAWHDVAPRASDDRPTNSQCTEQHSTAFFGAGCDQFNEEHCEGPESLAASTRTRRQSIRFCHALHVHIDIRNAVFLACKDLVYSLTLFIDR